MKEENPDVLMPCTHLGRPDLEQVTMRGNFRRITSLTGKEHSAVMFLVHHEERFAPCHGHGLLITEATYRKFR